MSDSGGVSEVTAEEPVVLALDGATAAEPSSQQMEHTGTEDEVAQPAELTESTEAMESNDQTEPEQSDPSVVDPEPVEEPHAALTIVTSSADAGDADPDTDADALGDSLVESGDAPMSASSSGVSSSGSSVSAPADGPHRSAFSSFLSVGGLGLDRRSSYTYSDAGDLSEEMLAAPSFQKTLSSDVSAEQSMELLREVHAFEPIFGELFESADLLACSSILSVLRFAPGDRIIQAGEEATFAALLLSGEVIAQVTPHIQVPLVKSSWVGEMAFFERGPRSADITARTSAVLAVLSYEDLERLASDGQAELQNKFTMLLAMHSIKKLRLMAPLSQSTTGNAQSDDEQDPAAIKSAVRGSRTSRRKKETLFVERLKKQSEALAAQEAKQKAELASMQNLVKKKVVEAQHAHATVKHKIAKLESENRDLLTRVSDLTKKIGVERKHAKAAVEQATRALQEKIDALAAVPDYDSIIQAEKAKVKQLEASREKFEAALEQRVKSKEDDIISITAQLSTERHLAHQAAVIHEAAMAEHQPVIAERDRLMSDIVSIRDKVHQLEHANDYAEYKLKELHAEKLQADSECAGWRRKSTDYVERYDKLLHMYRLDMFEASKEKKRITQSHHTYQKLIRVLSLKTFVRNFLLRRFLFNIHLRISEMVVARWEEKIESTWRERDRNRRLGKDVTPDASSLYQQLMNASNRNRRLAEQHANNGNSGAGVEEDAPTSTALHPLLQPYAFVGSLAAPADASNPASDLSVFSYTSESETQHYPKEHLRIEKRKYLLALKSSRNPPPSIASLLQSIEDELVELKTPVDEMNLALVELRHTVDAFFKRNIQLTAKCINTKKALEVACANYEALKDSVRARHVQEHGANPFSQRLLSDANKQLAGRRTGGGTPGGADEKDDSISPPASARSAPGRGRIPSSGGDIDWAALDHEKSSGYGVTRPMVRRESKLVNVPPGSTLRTPTAAGGNASRRTHSFSLTPRPPPAAASTTPSPGSVPSAVPTIGGLAPFALPKVG